MPRPLHLLLVEDSERDARLLVRLLRQGGYDVSFERVESAETMAAALDAASWDLVIADFAAPGFTAPAALRLVTDRGLDMPFIIVSGSMSPEVAAQMMRVGASDFLAKNDLTRLLPVIERELRDVAERRAHRAAEDVLRSSEDSLRLLFATNPQPMWLFDRHTGRFFEINEAAITLFGYSRDEFLAMRLTDLLPPNLVSQVLAHVQQPRAGLRHAGTWRLPSKDRHFIEVEIAAYPLHFAGRIAGLLVATDTAAGKRPPASRSLTVREREVLQLLVQGVTSNRELAVRLVVSENTVKYHVRNILTKLHLQNRAQAIAYALRHGLVDQPDVS